MRIAILPANKPVLDVNGEWVEFSTADLDEIASSYSSENPAPVVIGHPKDNGPAFGWWDKVERIANHLFAEVDDEKLDLNFQKALENRHFRNWSASVYRRDSTANPKQGKLNLRHVGFLGAKRPAFGNLFNHPQNQFNFAESDSRIYTFEFMEYDSLKALETITLADIASALGIEESALQAAIDQSKPEPEMPAEFSEKESELSQREAAIAVRERALEAQEHTSFCENIVNEGKPLPAPQSEIVEFMVSLPKTEELSFSEGKKQKSVDWFKGLLSNLPKQVILEEISGQDEDLNFAENPQAIAAESRRYREEMKKSGRTISVAESVSYVVKRGKK